MRNHFIAIALSFVFTSVNVTAYAKPKKNSKSPKGPKSAKSPKGPNSRKSTLKTLRIIYDSLDGPNWTNNQNGGAAPVQNGRKLPTFNHMPWFNKTDESDENYCTWYGLKCDDEDKIIEIDLSANGLFGIFGSIPFTSSDIVNIILSSVESLVLSNNELFGKIPAETLELMKLEVFDVSDNNLSGTIPQTSNVSPNLESLDMSANNLSGTIPVEILEPVSLAELNLSGNNLSGTIPQTSNVSPNLESLDVGNNQLTGAIPQSLDGIGSLNVSGNPGLQTPTNCQDFPKEIVKPGLTDILISNESIRVWEGNPLCLGTNYTSRESCIKVGRAYGVCTYLSRVRNRGLGPAPNCDSVDTWEISDANGNYGTLIFRGVTRVGRGSVVVGGTGCFEGAGGTVLSEATYTPENNLEVTKYNLSNVKTTHASPTSEQPASSYLTTTYPTTSASPYPTTTYLTT